MRFHTVDWSAKAAGHRGEERAGFRRSLKFFVSGGMPSMPAGTRVFDPAGCATSSGDRVLLQTEVDSARCTVQPRRLLRRQALHPLPPPPRRHPPRHRCAAAHLASSTGGPHPARRATPPERPPPTAAVEVGVSLHNRQDALVF